jgi:hypothetical protein
MREQASGRRTDANSLPLNPGGKTEKTECGCSAKPDIRCEREPDRGAHRRNEAERDSRSTSMMSRGDTVANACVTVNDRGPSPESAMNTLASVETTGVAR